MHSKRNFTRLLFLFFVAALVSAPSLAQEEAYIPELPKTIPSVDENGFDMANGNFVREVTLVSIGDSKKGGLGYKARNIIGLERVGGRDFEVQTGYTGWGFGGNIIVSIGDYRRNFWNVSHWRGGYAVEQDGELVQGYSQLSWGFEGASIAHSWGPSWPIGPGQNLNAINYSNPLYSDYDRVYQATNDQRVSVFFSPTEGVLDTGGASGSPITYPRAHFKRLVITADGRHVYFKGVEYNRSGVAYKTGLFVDRIEYPNGTTETYHYTVDSSQAFPITYLKAVTTNAGYMLHFQYDDFWSNTSSPLGSTSIPSVCLPAGYPNGVKPQACPNKIDGRGPMPKRVVAINTEKYNCNPLADVCSTTQGGDWPYVDLEWDIPEHDDRGNAPILKSFTNSLGEKTTTFPEWRSSQNPNTVDFGVVNRVQEGGFLRYDAIINGESWTYRAFKSATSGDQSCYGSAAGPNGYASSWSCSSRVPIWGSLSYQPSAGSVGALPVAQIFSYTVNGRTTTCEPDCNYRPLRITRPSGIIEEYEYDSNPHTGNFVDPHINARNITKHTIIPKPGSSAAPTVHQWTYPADTPTNRYSNYKTFNKPTSYTDPNGNTTNYTYDQDSGGIKTVERPAPGAGLYASVRPTANLLYQQNSAGIYNLIRSVFCSQSASCDGAPDAVITEWQYTTPHAQVSKAIQIDAASAGNLATNFTYTPLGDIASVDGPLPGTYDTTYSYYDVLRRSRAEVAADPDGTGPDRRGVVRYTYNADGNIIQIDAGHVDDPNNWNSLTVTTREKSYFDGYSRLTRRDAIEIGGAQNGQAGTITQYNYDDLQRVKCIAQRMNPATFQSLPDACSRGTAGAFGDDRVTLQQYNVHGEVTKVIQALGTPVQRDYKTYVYNADGTVQSVTDAKGNLTRYDYDGFNRLHKTSFPSKTTSGQASTTDYETYTYDASGNRTSLRKRDGRIINYVYDDLDRLSLKDVPAPDRDVYYDYDLRNLETSALFDSAAGPGLHNTYDTFGRLISTTSDLTSSTLSHEYDEASNRTRVTHPDGNFFSYDTDYLNRLTHIRENGGDWINQFTYDQTSRLTGIDHRDRMAWTVGYDALSRIASLGIDAQAGISSDLTETFAFNPASQLVERTRSNTAYSQIPQAPSDVSYAANGLNQYTNVDGSSFTYDGNGNLTSDGTSTYTYDSENRLLSVSGPGNPLVSLKYDPYGRLYEVSGTVVTRFVYDGDAMIQELDGSNTLLRRYVHGNGIDDPLVWYEGATLDPATRKHLASDRQGSIIAVAESITNAPVVNTYSPYGIPAATNLGRFSYTGQMIVPEIDLLYYKARIYSPDLGRFLQTDPVGYDDQMNMYAYVRNDPMNNIDPSGKNVVCAAGTPGMFACSIVAAVILGIGIADLILSDILTNDSNDENIEKESDWTVPPEVADKIPEEWGEGKPNRKSNGRRWRDPKNSGNGVRVDEGDPESSYPSQRPDHVRVDKDGRPIRKDGTPLPPDESVADNAEDTHIPVEDYAKWECWYAPSC